MLQALKRFFWDLKDPIGRFNYWCGIWRNFPGHLGMDIRSKYIPRYFAEAGTGIVIHEGLRIRNVHKLVVGDSCELGVDNFLQAGGGIHLGRRVMLGPGVKIWSINHNFDQPDVPINEQGYTRDPVSIGDDCWLGANVFVFPGVVLPEGCVVSAGSVVTKKRFPPYSILAGYPARVIGNRRPREEPGAEAADPEGRES